MTNVKTSTLGTQIALFVTSLYVALWAIALLLHIAALRFAFAVVLLLIAVGVLLSAFAWILRKFWSMSGRVAIALTHKGRDSQKARLSRAESENGVQA